MLVSENAYYQTHIEKIKGSSFKEIYKKAEQIFLNIKKKSKRKPYIRSVYFGGEKIFLDYFWEHLFRKQNLRDKQRRVAFYAIALEIMQKSKMHPESVQNPNKKNEILHRFYGKAKGGEKCIVQIKEDTKDDKKYFISVFPI